MHALRQITTAPDRTPGVLLLDHNGQISASTLAARRLLALAANPGELRSCLRALAGRSSVADDGHPVVIALPTSPAGRLLLTAAHADRQLVVTVEAQTAKFQEPTFGSLTAREREVLALVLQGLPAKRIATQLELSQWTIRDHLRSIFNKTGVNNRNELAALALHRATDAA